jgi:hypothetical protein
MTTCQTPTAKTCLALATIVAARPLAQAAHANVASQHSYWAATPKKSARKIAYCVTNILYIQQTVGLMSLSFFNHAFVVDAGKIMAQRTNNT